MYRASSVPAENRFMSNSKRQPAGIPIGGQFAANQHDAAMSALSEPLPIDVERRGAELEAEHDTLLQQETAAWFAHEFESLVDDHGTSVFVTFDEDDGSRSFFVEDGKEYGELGDRATDLIPEGIPSGSVTMSYEDGKYVTVLDDGESETTYVYDAGGKRLNEVPLAGIASQLTSDRATARDEAEKVAIIAAFEQVSWLNDRDSMTFTPKAVELDGNEVRTLSYDGNFSVAPSSEMQSHAFGFYGQGVKSVTVTRESDGYTITREHESFMYPGKTKTLTDRVTSETKSRWSDPGLIWDEEDNS